MKRTKVFYGKVNIERLQERSSLMRSRTSDEDVVNIDEDVGSMLRGATSEQGGAEMRPDKTKLKKSIIEVRKPSTGSLFQTI
jgi:hypothetical protein